MWVALDLGSRRGGADWARLRISLLANSSRVGVAICRGNVGLRGCRTRATNMVNLCAKCMYVVVSPCNGATIDTQCGGRHAM